MKGGAFLPVLVAGATPLILIALVMFGSTLGLVAWKPPVLWTDQFGTPQSGVTSVAATSTDLFVAWILGFNGTRGKPFLRYYDTGGSVGWTSIISSPNVEGLVGISVGSDGVFVAGEGFQNDTLLKYDFKGNQLWGRIMAGPLYAISAEANHVYVAGGSSKPVTNQTFTGPSIYFVREFDSNGSVIWTSEFSNDTNISAVPIGIFAGVSEVYVLTGYSLAGFNSTGSELWWYNFGAPGLIYTDSVSADSTGVYVSGTASSSTLSPGSGFLSKYDAIGGRTLWTAKFDSPDGSGVGHSSLWTDYSGVYLSMDSISGNDYVMKFDSNGNQVWSFQTAPQPAARVSPDNFLVAAGPDRFYIAGDTWPARPAGGVYSLVQAYAASSSLVFFGVNPPFSFLILGTLVTGAVACVFLFRRLRRARTRPSRVGPPNLSLPARD